MKYAYRSTNPCWSLILLLVTYLRSRHLCYSIWIIKQNVPHLAGLLPRYICTYYLVG